MLKSWGQTGLGLELLTSASRHSDTLASALRFRTRPRINRETTGGVGQVNKSPTLFLASITATLLLLSFFLSQLWRKEPLFLATTEHQPRLQTPALMNHPCHLSVTSHSSTPTLLTHLNWHNCTANSPCCNHCLTGRLVFTLALPQSKGCSRRADLSSASRENMSNIVLETLVFLKCNSDI